MLFSCHDIVLVCETAHTVCKTLPPVLVQVAVYCLYDPGPAGYCHALHAWEGWLGLDQHGWEQLTSNGQPGSPQVCSVCWSMRCWVCRCSMCL